MLMHMTSRFNQLRREMNGEAHDRSGGFLNFHEVLGELSGARHRGRHTAQSFAIRMRRRRIAAPARDRVNLLQRRPSGRE